MRDSQNTSDPDETVHPDDRSPADREGTGKGGPLSSPDEYGANEREQTVERERAGRTRLDESGMVTDAEVEAREQRRARDD